MNLEAPDVQISLFESSWGQMCEVNIPDGLPAHIHKEGLLDRSHQQPPVVNLRFESSIGNECFFGDSANLRNVLPRQSPLGPSCV